VGSPIGKTLVLLPLVCKKETDSVPSHVVVNSNSVTYLWVHEHITSRNGCIWDCALAKSGQSGHRSGIYHQVWGPLLVKHLIDLPSFREKLILCLHMWW
jgi:hypothetical protein